MKPDLDRGILLPSFAEITATLNRLERPTGPATLKLMVFPLHVDGAKAGGLYDQAWAAPIIGVTARSWTEVATTVWRWSVTEMPEFHL